MYLSYQKSINPTTNALEISPDGASWYECIPAVGANVIKLLTYDNTSYSYKYWICPGQTIVIIPIVYAKDVAPFFSVAYYHNFSSEQWIGLRSSNIAIGSKVKN